MFKKRKVISTKNINDKYSILSVPANSKSPLFNIIPGQYILLKTEKLEPRYFVISNWRNSRNEWEFLINKNTSFGFHLSRIKESDHIEISKSIIGNGFNIKGLERKDVVCIVGGTGIASIRPLIQYFNYHSDNKNLRPNYYKIIYLEKGNFHFPDWETVKNAQLIDTTDYRIDNFSRFINFKNLENTIFFISGPSGLLNSIRNEFVKIEIKEENIRTNI